MILESTYTLIPAKVRFAEVESDLPPGAKVGGFTVGPQGLQQGGVNINGAQEFFTMGLATNISTGVGIFMGSDQAATKGYDWRVGDPAGNYAQWDASTGIFSIVGTLTATTGSIGGFDIGADYVRDVANSMGLSSTVSGSDDVRFWAGDTFTNRATADFRVTEAGAVTASSMTITGGLITGTPIASIPNNSSTDISLLDFTHDLVFSVTDKDTVAWASGTITMSNGRTFSITGSNTGNMAARTYIYLDTAVSSTALQLTTVVATAMGANKKLIGVAQNGVAEASFQVNEGIGGLKITEAMTSLANNDWQYSGTWSVTDADTIAWGSGTLTTSNGGSYSITGSNTGNMSAKTFIYFDLGVSATAFQTTTTSATAIGAGKILIATAQNATGEAKFIVMNDQAYNIDAASIVAGSVTANEIAASTITGANILTMNIAGKTATFDTGTIGGFTMAATQLTATNFSVTSGAANTARVEVGTSTNIGGVNSGNAAGDIAFWAGSTHANRATAPFRVTMDGSIVATSATISGYVVSGKGAFGGDGSDGALSGTTAIDLGGARLVVKQYTSISITGSAAVTFTNPHANGTFIILKSQGAVTLTSSATPMIDASGMGAEGGAGGGASGTVGSNAQAGMILVTGGAGAVGGGGAGGLKGDFSIISAALAQITGKYPYVVPGSGGGGGEAAGGSTGGTGGRGGGVLIIECAGAWNFTTAAGISVQGKVGGNGSGAAYGAGGAGGGGMAIAFYNTLTANSGTISVAAVAGGTGSGGAESGGGGGASVIENGTAGDSTATSDGGEGGDGFSLVALNTQYA